MDSNCLVSTTPTELECLQAILESNIELITLLYLIIVVGFGLLAVYFSWKILVTIIR